MKNLSLSVDILCSLSMTTSLNMKFLTGLDLCPGRNFMYLRYLLSSPVEKNNQQLLFVLRSFSSLAAWISSTILNDISLIECLFKFLLVIAFKYKNPELSQVSSVCL